MINNTIFFLIIQGLLNHQKENVLVLLRLFLYNQLVQNLTQVSLTESMYREFHNTQSLFLK